MNVIINTALFIAIIASLVYVWRGTSGRGWHVPSLSEMIGPVNMPDTGGFGSTVACKWNGTC